VLRPDHFQRVQDVVNQPVKRRRVIRTCRKDIPITPPRAASAFIISPGFGMPARA
jgi:hypothetical protein